MPNCFWPTTLRGHPPSIPLSNSLQTSSTLLQRSHRSLGTQQPTPSPPTPSSQAGYSTRNSSRSQTSLSKDAERPVFSRSIRHGKRLRSGSLNERANPNASVRLSLSDHHCYVFHNLVTHVFDTYRPMSRAPLLHFSSRPITRVHICTPCQSIFDRVSLEGDASRSRRDAFTPCVAHVTFLYFLGALVLASFCPKLYNVSELLTPRVLTPSKF